MFSTPKSQKLGFLFCIVLTYSYLCPLITGMMFKCERRCDFCG